ncbi:TPA: hypothetical protein ACGF3W_000310 [Vibrio cholerae]
MSVKGISRVKKKFAMFSKDVDQVRTDTAVYTILSEGGALAQLMTPIDTGTLANSQYAPQITHTVGHTKGTIGYTAEYAGAVHEMPGVLKGLPRANGSGNHWDPDAEPQFLTKGFEQLRNQIPSILKRAYSV